MGGIIAKSLNPMAPIVPRQRLQSVVLPRGRLNSLGGLNAQTLRDALKRDIDAFSILEEKEEGGSGSDFSGDDNISTFSKQTLSPMVTGSGEASSPMSADSQPPMPNM